MSLAEDHPSPQVAAPPEGGRFDGWRNLSRRSRGLSLRTLVILRWMAIAGQSATLLIATAWFHFDLPLWGCLAAVAASVAMNLNATARLRRTEGAGASPRGEVIEVDDRLKLDFDRREVWLDGKLVKLRPTEYRLLYHLVQNAGWVLTYDQLLTKVWGYEYRDEPHYVRLYVNYLRQKLEEDPSNPQYILTERGVGYRFVDFRRQREQAA